MDKPYAVWGSDLATTNRQFLDSMDAEFYQRTAVSIIESFGGEEALDDPDKINERKDTSTLTRLLWHHAAETLAMTIGACVQAPDAVHAYFLRCRTEDVIQLAQLISKDSLPKLNRFEKNDASVNDLMQWVFSLCREEVHAERFVQSICQIYSMFTEKSHRAEYNSIKHGLRVSHGALQLRIGLEHEYGVSPPADEFKTLGASPESSSFLVAKKFEWARGQENSINFHMEKVTVAFSSDKIIRELQVMKMIMHNIIVRLKIYNGFKGEDVKFFVPEDPAEFWESYDQALVPTLNNYRFSENFDEREIQLLTADEVKKNYSR